MYIPTTVPVYSTFLQPNIPTKLRVSVASLSVALPN